MEISKKTLAGITVLALRGAAEGSARLFADGQSLHDLLPDWGVGVATNVSTEDPSYTNLLGLGVATDIATYVAPVAYLAFRGVKHFGTEVRDRTVGAYNIVTRRRSDDSENPVRDFENM